MSNQKQKKENDIVPNSLVKERYKLLFEYSTDIILFVSGDGRIIDANKAALTAYGYTYEELTSMHIHQLRLQYTDELINYQLQKAALSGILFETVHIRKDGSEFHVEVNSKGITINGETLLVSIVRDCTERKKVDQELAQYRKQLAALVEERTVELQNINNKLNTEIMIRQQKEEELNTFFTLSLDAFIIFNFDGTIRRMNLGFAQMLGYDQNELEESNLTDEFIMHIHLEDLDRTKRMFRSLIEGNSVKNFEIRCRCKDGSYKWFSWNAVSLPNKRLIYAVARNINEQKS